MGKRNKQLSRKQKDVMTRRSNRQVATCYIYRREAWERDEAQQGDRYGFLAPIERHKRGHVLRMAHLAPQRWEVLCIIYCRAHDGSEYRESAARITDQAFAAWLERRDSDGKVIHDESGQAIFDDQLTPLIRDTMGDAEAGCNHNHIIDRAVVIRPRSRQWPSIVPVLRRIKRELDLTDSEIAEFEEWEAA